MPKKNLIIRFISVIAVIAVIFSGAVLQAGAFTDTVGESPTRPFPQNIRVTWYRLNKLTSVKREAEKTVMNFSVNNTEYKLYLCFPNEGGFRLCSDDQGYFEPKSLKKLTYKNQNGGVMITAGGDTSVLLREKSGDWAADIYYKTLLVYRVTGKQLSVGYDRNGKLAKTRMEGTIGSKETLTGLGERFDSVTRNGTQSLLWNLDVGEHINSETEKDTDFSYTNIPLLHSTNGYSLFFNSSYAIMADIGKTNSKKYTLDNYGKTMDFYFWTGNIENRLNEYMSLTGHNILPPKWAFSYWAGNSAVYWQTASGGSYLNELDNMIKGYEKIGTPVQSMFVEGVIYKDPKVHSLLKKQGINLIAWHDSGYYNRPTDALPGLSADEMPIVKSYYYDSSILDVTARYIDFTNPLSFDVIDYLQSKYLQYGTKGAMIDFADAVPVDSVFSNGKTGDEMHNIYSYYYQQAFKKLYEKYNGNDYILFARAGYSGSQSLMAKFLGDNATTFYGMKKSLTAGLNLSLSGFSVWGSDMGGLGMATSSKPTEDVYRRWVQWSAFNPLFRSHGHTTRVPWDYSTAAVREFQKYFWLRENLLDAIYSAAIDGTTTSKVIAAPLMQAFPNQMKLSRVEDEYMFCNELLVAPVTDASKISRSVVLPAGNWTNFWTGKNISGDTTVTDRASEGTIPLYLRSGAVIPLSLAEDLTLASAMSDSNRVDALLISPATGKREIKINKDENTSVKYTTDRPAYGTTLLTNVSGAKTRAVIAKGISASAVKVDGKALTELNEVYAGGREGYSVDRTGNTTTIWLPESWKTLEITAGGGIRKNLAFGKTAESDSEGTGNRASSITDSDPENYFTLSRSNTELLLDLGESKEFDEIQLTWGLNYAKSYTVECSEDGSYWETVATVKDGVGDEEVLNLEKMFKARYIRFSGFKNGGSGPAELAEVRVYGTEKEFVGICDITGKVLFTSNNGNSEKPDNEDEYEYYEEEYTEFEDGDQNGDGSSDSWLKKVIRRRKAASSNWWIIPVVAGAVLVAGGGTALFIVLKRKKKKGKPDTATPKPNT